MSYLAGTIWRVQRTCGLPDCGKTHRAKGYCSTHYNQLVLDPTKRHAKVETACSWCTLPIVKDRGREKRYGGLFCSFSCRDQWTIANGKHSTQSPESNAKRTATRMARAATRRSQARLKLRRAARGSLGTRWVGGVCARCGAAFVSALGTDLGRYCSNRCKRRARAARRRARVRGARHDGYSRYAIFVRDGWRCHICHRMTDRTQVVPHARAPVIDHLVPLADGGDDTSDNVACACFECNSKRRDVGAAQLLLFG